MSPVPRRRRLVSQAAATLLLVGSVTISGAESSYAAPLNECAPTDNGDPVIESFTLGRTSVDIRDKGRAVTVDIVAHDTGGPGAASGVKYIQLTADRYNYESLHGTAQAELTYTEGHWRGRFWIPRWSRPGTWRLTLRMADRAFFHHAYDSGSVYLGPEQLAEAGFPSSIEVVGDVDTSRPILKSLRFSPDSVDTRRRPQKVTFRARVADTQSGVWHVGIFASNQQYRYSNVFLRRIRPGVFGGELTVPRWAGTTRWVLTADIEDRYGNFRGYGAAKLTEMGVTPSIDVTSRDDLAPPTVTKFALAQSTVDVTSADGSVAVTVRATDDAAGIGSVWVWFASPSGLGSAKGRLRLVSGTRQRGVWRGTLGVARCGAKPGDWYANLYLGDRVGHQSEYRSAALNAHAWPSRLTVLNVDRVPPRAFGREFTPPAVGPFVVSFNEAVNGITATSALLRQGNLGEPGAPVVGSWSCVRRDGLSTDCGTGRVRTASFTPTAPVNAGDYLMTMNPEHNLEITDLAGNPFMRVTIGYSVE